MRSATIVPMYRVGMVVKESGRVDHTPRLTSEVISATKTCWVRAYPVDPMASNIPAAYYSSEMLLLADGEYWIWTFFMTDAYNVLSNIRAGSINHVAERRSKD
jgi:hypothetical protein